MLPPGEEARVAPTSIALHTGKLAHLVAIEPIFLGSSIVLLDEMVCGNRSTGNRGYSADLL
jgi:hypothetical protein